MNATVLESSGRDGRPVAARSGMGLSRLSLTLRDDDHARRCCLAACDQPADYLEQLAGAILADSEAARLARAAHPRRRLSFLRGRTAAKEALAGLCGEGDRRGLEISAGVFDQPVVTSRLPNLGVTLSHTDRLAVAAAFPESHPVGLDVESVAADNSSVLREQAVPGELERLSALGVAEGEALTLLWSAKEAASKVLRGGLAVDFRTLEVTDAAKRGRLIDLRFAAFAHLRAEVIVAGQQVLAVVVPTRCRAQWDVGAALDWLGAGGDRQAPE